MIKQSFIDNDSILEKKFKILRMSIMLGNIQDRESTLKEYENTAREIDRYKREIYEEILSSKMYTTTTLEEEKDRLTDLIEFIEKRINERNEFIDDYLMVTNNFLDNIEEVSSIDELPEYRNRLGNIVEYLSNIDEINDILRKLEDKRKELEEKYETRANNEVINGKLEEELIDEFTKIITNDEYYKNLNYLDIDLELDTIEKDLVEKKDVLETFVSSFEALKNAGISGAEREEYLSYVEDAKKDYYKSLERKYILEIYKLVLDKTNDYDKLNEKRINIEKLLSDRLTSRKDLDINDRDILEYFSNICKEQFSIIKSEKIINEGIDKLVFEITNYEERLEELEKINHRSEIVSLLEEFSEEVVEINKDKDEVIDDSVNYDDIFIKEIVEDTKPANMVVKIRIPFNMDVNRAVDTAKLVMKKVVIALNPKRFNSKKEEVKVIENIEEPKIIEDKKIGNSEFVGIKLDENSIFTDQKDDISNQKIELVNDLSIPIKPSIEKVSDEVLKEDIVKEEKQEVVDLFKETLPFVEDEPKKEKEFSLDIPNIVNNN